MLEKEYECCILGTGPAGLGAAMELVKNGVKDIILIDKNKIVGGLSRTELFDGYRFDVGPHRFFTKNSEINALWKNTLGNDFIPVERLTRIYYKNKYFNYPIKAVDALMKMGMIESTHALLSFLSAQVFKKNREAQTFEDWITQKFGKKLYTTFFKTYTEKVWGIPCNQIGAEWAAQRIKGLDILQVIKSALQFTPSKNIKTLVEQFDYPRKGAGQMYEAMAETVMNMGAEILLSSEVKSFNRTENKINSVLIKDENGREITIKAKSYFNSIPLTHFYQLLSPQENSKIKNAVEALYYREHITVNFIIDGADIFPDQWIYVHDPNVKMARLANYNNFSKEMVNGKNKTAVSVEYFVFKTDDIWTLSDNELKELAMDELSFVNLVDKKKVEQGWVVRETESYPTYYLGYQDHYNILKERSDQFENVHPIGRGGLYKYNNQDHSTLSGILAARNYLKLDGSPYNIWNINIDAEYHEAAVRE
jgi:protoporphyrinogen oxidase